MKKNLSILVIAFFLIGIYNCSKEGANQYYPGGINYGDNVLKTFRDRGYHITGTYNGDELKNLVGVYEIFPDALDHNSFRFNYVDEEDIPFLYFQISPFTAENPEELKRYDLTVSVLNGLCYYGGWYDQATLSYNLEDDDSIIDYIKIDEINVRRNFVKGKLEAGFHRQPDDSIATTIRPDSAFFKNVKFKIPIYIREE